MPYSIQLPDGTSVDNIPDELSPEEAKKQILARRPDLGPPAPTGDTSGFGAAFGAGLKDLQGQFALTRGKMGLLDDEEAKSIYAKKKAESEAGLSPASVPSSSTTRPRRRS